MPMALETERIHNQSVPLLKQPIKEVDENTWIINGKNEDPSSTQSSAFVPYLNERSKLGKSQISSVKNLLQPKLNPSQHLKTVAK